MSKKRHGISYALVVYSPLALAGALVVFSASVGRTATQYFSDAGGPLPWNTTTANWGSVSGGPYTKRWSSGNAVFKGTGGTVNVGSVTASNLTFNVVGYNLSGGTLALGGSIAANQFVTFGSIISGAAGLTMTGSGTLVISANQTYAGPTIVSGGKLPLTNAQLYANANWAARSITVNNGGVMVVKGWGDQDALNGVPGIGQTAFSASN